VSWRDPDAHRSHIVARLARTPAGSDASHYEFVCVRGATEARQHGFTPITSFAHLERVYRSDVLFPFFTNRIMSSSRPEYPRMLDRVLLPQGPSDPLALLARTGGVRATDTFETFAMPRYNEESGDYQTLFLVHGLRWLPQASHERITGLAKGDQLYLMEDFQNAHDPAAMALRTDDRFLVGHVPNWLLLDLFELARQCRGAEVFVENVSPAPAPLDQRLLCSLHSCWPAEFTPFSDVRFEPIPTEAIATSVLLA